MLTMEGEGEGDGGRDGEELLLKAINHVGRREDSRDESRNDQPTKNAPACCTCTDDSVRRHITPASDRRPNG